MALNNLPDSHWTGYFRLAPETDYANPAVKIGGGIVLPSFTTAQRDALANVPTGTVIYNSTTNKVNVRVAAAWEAITSA